NSSPAGIISRPGTSNISARAASNSFPGTMWYGMLCFAFTSFAQAIASSISETVEVLVSPEDLDSPESLFEMFSPEGKETCSSLEEALRLAEETGKRIARERAERSGACSIAYDIVRSDRHMGLRGMDVLVECVISVTAAGMPSMFGAENL
ncbi:MAG: hypothetical protein IJ904_01790, partial [Candidatus Methanomethylophilaceae archaeon]|nr:hypothetical protein [Candidatus Methanomethylophilaceae archaeon]